MGAIERDWLQQILHELVLLCVDGIIELIQEEIVIVLPLFLLLAEGLEVLLAFLHSDQVEGGGHLLRDLGALDLPHGLAHLLLVRVRDAHDLVGCGDLTLAHLVRVFHL